MKIYETSFSTKFYQWFYCLDFYELPKNLCPYFWRMLFAIIICVPYAIFCVPAIARETIDSIRGTYYYGQTETTKRISFSFTFYFFTGFLICMGFAVADFFFIDFARGSIQQTFVGSGIVGWVILCLLLFLYLVSRIFEGTSKVASRSITVQYVKSWYHKYCPPIELINKEDETRQG